VGSNPTLPSTTRNTGTDWEYMRLTSVNHSISARDARAPGSRTGYVALNFSAEPAKRDLDNPFDDLPNDLREALREVVVDKISPPARPESSFFFRIIAGGGLDRALNNGLEASDYSLPDDVRVAWNRLVLSRVEDEKWRHVITARMNQLGYL
jgi:hypothetical protein